MDSAFPDRKPTSSEATNNNIVDGCMAAWYPQMGGYVAMCWVRMGCYDNIPPTSTPGFDALVWHDGEFPFGDDDDRSPALLHHCGSDQFIDFGESCQRFLETHVMQSGSNEELRDRILRAIRSSSSHGTVHLKNRAVADMLKILRGE